MKEKNKNNIKKFIKIAAVVIAVLIALYGAAYLIITFTTGDPMPMPLGFGSAVVLTGSMEPTLSVNDLIFVVRSGRYNVNDIVVYSTGGTPVVHRIVSIDEKSGAVVTKGDANNVEDAPISMRRIKGKLLFSLPFVGVIPKFVRTVPGIIIVLTLLFTLLYISVHSKAKAAEEDEKAEKIKAEIERLKKSTGATEEDIAAVDLRSALEKEIDELKKKLGETAKKNETADTSDK